MPNEPLPEWEALLSSAAPVGSLDGIETGVRQLIRDQPLETEVIEISGEKLTVPTRAEMLRLEYQDWAAVAEKCRELANVLW